MIARIVFSLCLTGATVCFDPSGAMTWAEEPRTTTYSLPDILALALQHNPAVAGAEGFVKQSHGQQIAAGAYPNPSVSGQRRPRSYS